MVKLRRSKMQKSNTRPSKTMSFRLPNIRGQKRVERWSTDVPRVNHSLFCKPRSRASRCLSFASVSDFSTSPLGDSNERSVKSHCVATAGLKRFDRPDGVIGTLLPSRSTRRAATCVFCQAPSQIESMHPDATRSDALVWRHGVCPKQG